MSACGAQARQAEPLHEGLHPMFARRVRGERRLGQPGNERRRALQIAIDPHGDVGTCGALARNSITSPDVGRMFTDLRTPTVRSIAPSAGPASGGNRATLAGFFFVPVTAVTIGGVAAPFTAVDIATLEVTVPAGRPGTADVVVQFAGGTAITLPNAYGYISPLPPRASGGGGGNPDPVLVPRP